jgi:hypothetical protein
MQLMTTGAFMMISYAVSRNNFGIFQKDLTFNIYNNGSYLRFLYYIRNTDFEKDHAMTMHVQFKFQKLRIF